MTWLAATGLAGNLPDHCEPATDFLLLVSRTFHTCIPTPLAFASIALGLLSILSWLFAQLPQIYKNWRVGSTSGLSIFFLVEWLLGDISNLLGALFTHQASWQVAIGAYYVFVDLCLVGQWIWYERLRHGNLVKRVWRRRRGDESGGWRDGEAMVEGPRTSTTPGTGPKSKGKHVSSTAEAKKPATLPQLIFRTPGFDQSKGEREKPSSSLSATPNGTTIYRVVGASSPLPSPSPRTVLLLVVCLSALARATPLNPTETPSHHHHHQPHPRTPLETLGTALSWLSTALYLGSRLPQLLKNFHRKSTAGLSPLLFAAAFSGNAFYSAALATNPSAWADLGPHGGRGWAGPTGNDRAAWVADALPFFLGAAGVLGLDASVGLQFLLYGEGGSRVVVVEEEGEGGELVSGAVRPAARWRRVSGWMRGWIPGSVDEGRGAVGVREPLLRRPTAGGPAEGEGRYGAS